MLTMQNPTSEVISDRSCESCLVPARGSVCDVVADRDIRVCPVCSETTTHQPYPQAWFWLKACPECGLMFAAPQPSDQELASIYSASYFETFGYTPASAAAYREMKRMANRKILSDVRHLCPDLRDRRLLDVGSGLGDLLSAARDDGWTVTGIEQNPWAVAESERIAPNATLCGTLADADLPAESFDLITCLDVLEHLRDPAASLRRMFHWLRPGGALLITTVDTGSWLARFTGWRWVHFHRDHLWYFNRAALVRLVTAAGFELVLCDVPHKVFNLRYLLTILSHHGRQRLDGRLCGRLLDTLPAKFLSATLPTLAEGLRIVARKPS